MLKIGDKVLCRYYNTPDRKFYGDYFTGIIESIEKNNVGEKFYFVNKELSGIYYQLGLHRKEIKKVLQ
jgi:hypothetical protein